MPLILLRQKLQMKRIAYKLIEAIHAMKLRVKLILYSALLFCASILFQGCYCYNGWGYNAISKSGYFPIKDWSDTARFFNIMNQLKDEHPSLVLKTSDAEEYALKEFKKIDSALLYTEIDCPVCLPDVDCKCIHSWYLIARDKQIVYKVGLFSGGFAITEAYLKRGGKTLYINKYDLCDLKSKERKKLYKEITDCFENEIIPVMQLYFF